ncbi:MAG: glycosyltransferase family 2 protein [Candidatus Omnitrophota bacterium]|jgi:hypothetical protein
MKLYLSIIIVNWNVKHLICDCLNSIKTNLSDLQYEVIVVDNASSDGSVVTLSEHYPWVKLIINNLNCGFSRANNQGFKISQGEYVLILNPDTLIKDKSIQNMIMMFSLYSEVGIVGPRIVDQNGDIEFSCKRRHLNLVGLILKRIMLEKIFVNLVTRFNFLKKIFYKKFYKTEVAECLSGACMLVRRIDLEKVGYFDESVPMYLDDKDLCFRFWKVGYKNYFCSEAEIIHIGGASTKKTDNSKLFDVLVYQSIDIFFLKHGKYFNFLLHRITLVLTSVFFLFIDIVLLVFIWNKKYVVSIISKHLFTLKYCFCGKIKILRLDN